MISQAAGVLIIKETSDEKKYLLVQSKRHKGWSPPKGYIFKKETLVEAAIREVREETGLILNLNYELINPEDIYFDTSYENKLIKQHNVKKTRYFLGRLLNEDKNIKICLDELINYDWFNANNAKEIMNFKEMTNLINFFCIISIKPIIKN